MKPADKVAIEIAVRRGEITKEFADELLKEDEDGAVVESAEAGEVVLDIPAFLRKGTD